jgi:hypothetical protein
VTLLAPLAMSVDFHHQWFAQVIGTEFRTHREKIQIRCFKRWAEGKLNDSNRRKRP